MERCKISHSAIKSEALAINFSNSCNNNCIFCFCREKDAVIQKLVPAPEDSFQGVNALLVKHKDKRGAVIISGNEPTLNKELFRVVDAAKKNGYFVILKTNGRMFYYKDYCRAIIDANIEHITVSLLSHSAIIHDRLTRVAGSFEQTYTGLLNLLRGGFGGGLGVCATVTRANYRNMPKLAALMDNIGVKSLQLNAVYSADSKLSPRFTMFNALFRSMIGRYRQTGLGIVTYGFPLCFLGDNWRCSSELGMREEFIVNCRVKTYSYVRKNLGKRKVSACNGCVLFKHCEGAWNSYFNIYGSRDISIMRHNLGW